MESSSSAANIIATTQENTARKLRSEEIFLSYEPLTNVMDHARIDLDQRDIEIELQKSKSKKINSNDNDNNDVFIQNALNIYIMGAHSKPYAFITLLLNDNENNYTKGTPVSGRSISGNIIHGILLNDFFHEPGSTRKTIEIQYASSLGTYWPITTSSGNNCQVGGSTNIVLDGCFNATGIIYIGNNKNLYRYQYDPITSNFNKRTIRNLSVNTEDEFTKQHYSDKFYNYYGRYDYADKFLRSAFDQSNRLDFNNGYIINFLNYDEDGFIEMIKRATVCMSIWMYAIREMENAIDICGANTTNCSILDNNDCNNIDETDVIGVVSSWDQAVAYYTGSSLFQNDLILAKGKGEYDGYLLYSLANEMCTKFATCSNSSSSSSSSSIRDNKDTAKVNIDIFYHFNKGQQNLLNTQCSSARKNKEEIAKLGFIPLIQGTIYYAYKDNVISYDDDLNLKNNDDDTTTTRAAIGLVFAASVLPIIYDCNKYDAEIIYNNMMRNDDREIDTSTTNFIQVKNAFERNYNCLGIKCADVGGIYNNNEGRYLLSAEPCSDDPNNNDDTMNWGLTIGLSIGLLFIPMVIVFLCSMHWKQN